jgi:hypothetical protein
MINKGTQMTTLIATLKADSTQNSWYNAGEKTKDGYVHNAIFSQDLLINLSDVQKNKILSRNSADILRLEVSSIHATEHRTYGFLHRYIAQRTKQKFGDDSVLKEVTGWTGYKADIEVFEYVRSVYKDTIDRLLLSK